MQKYILKQQFEGFSVSNTEGLHKGYDRRRMHGISCKRMVAELDRRRILKHVVTYGMESDSDTRGNFLFNTETSELVSELVINESNVECQPKVWSDAPIIEEYESDFIHHRALKKQRLLIVVSRHMTEKTSLSWLNFQSFNGGYAFGGGLACLIAKATTDESNKWHRRKEKQTTASVKAKSVSFISHSLQLLHMDLFRPTYVRSLNHKTYCLVITDDFSRFSWVFFLRTKDETSEILKDFIRQIKNQLNQKVKTIRSDNGTEFKNKDVIEFYGSKGIKRESSNARTPQQNGVAERKNRTLIEAARTMLADSCLTHFWAEAVSNAVYV
ncbi:putative ribonuclease H-like domain-containing protein [Tanacetum coccineum]